MDSDMGEELGDVVGYPFVGDEEASPPFGNFDFDVGEGELGDLLGFSDCLYNPLPVQHIVNIPSSSPLANYTHCDRIVTSIIRFLFMLMESMFPNCYGGARKLMIMFARIPKKPTILLLFCICLIFVSYEFTLF